MYHKFKVLDSNISPIFGLVMAPCNCTKPSLNLLLFSSFYFFFFFFFQGYNNNNNGLIYGVNSLNPNAKSNIVVIKSSGDGDDGPEYDYSELFPNGTGVTRSSFPDGFLFGAITSSMKV